MMRLSDDFEDKNAGMPVVCMAVGVVIFVLAVVGAVLYANRKPGGSGANSASAAVEEEDRQSVGLTGADREENTEAENDPYISGSKLTSNDLDFWHMYDVTEEEKAAAEAAKKEEEEKAEDPSTDGKHTKLTAEDGTEEWVSINPYLTKHTYDFSGLVYQYPIMKYYEDSEKVSRVGVHVSENDGNVNFSKLKKAGVEYAIIQLGARGYGSGNVMADQMFYENVNKAIEAGMDIGVSFFSQAVTEEEAVEEANRVIEGLQGFEIIYPVVFDMEYIKNDTARVQGLSKEEKTKVARAFLNTIEEAGYKTMIYGNKEWFIRKVDMTKLIGYDIWYTEEADIPDYPYKFTMWEYTKNAKMDGMEEPARLSICFIDYSAK